ncbi:MAG TPA: glycosyltransferase family 4 protein [Bacteroidales bacterium]|nr:glycosyltransferase family 4 protein [Bacteroidales bacterium]
MKILFISSGNAAEGISPIVKNQGESLIGAGLELEYFTIKGKGVFSYLKHIFLLRSYTRRTRFDLFHAHYSLSAFVATLAGCRPLVVSLMGSDIRTSGVIKTLIRFLSNHGWKKVIVKSSSMKSEIGIREAVILPNGVNLECFKPSAVNGEKCSGKVILFAADPGKYVKNYRLALEAFQLLSDDNITLRVFHSRPLPEVVSEINNAAVLLLTSRWEGSPNIVKEAMACNCPVVATDVGDVRWLFGNEPGYFITGFEPEDVAKNLRLALDFSKRCRRTNGRQRIIELGLDSDTVAKKLISLYSQVLERQI